MCCSVMQCIAACCSMLQCVSVCCSVSHSRQSCIQSSVIAHCNTLQHTATHCNTRQHIAAHCSTLKDTAAHCSTLQHMSVKHTICALRMDIAAIGSRRVYGSVLTGFLPSFPSQIGVSDVTFVTYFGDKKCDASNLSHFWEECDALAHENIFFNL